MVNVREKDMSKLPDAQIKTSKKTNPDELQQYDLIDSTQKNLKLAEESDKNLK